MKWFKNIFRRKKKQEPQPLQIDGIPPAPMTPEPDDAELAAQALLEMMADGESRGQAPDFPQASHQGASPHDSAHDAAYYKKLAERIRQAQEAARLRTMRFVSFVEQELEKPHLPVSGAGSLGLLEAELYKRLDVIERVGGELKRRWQHCLADVTVRLMQATSHTDDADDTKTKDTNAPAGSD